MNSKRSVARYGHLEHEYAEAFAEALCDNPEFRAWVLSKTKFTHRRGTRLLKEEMLALRTSPKALWWKNYFTPNCLCFGCAGGRETDVFAVLADDTGERFALHVEVKQPTDRFKPKVEQGKRYQIRAACWAAASPLTVPAHSDACTLILCGERKLDEFAAEIEPFDAVITFEEIAEKFPKATPLPQPPIAAEVPVSTFSLGQRVAHARFGDGTVSGVEGDKLEIEFDKVGQKTILDSFVKAA